MTWKFLKGKRVEYGFIDATGERNAKFMFFEFDESNCICGIYVPFYDGLRGKNGIWSSNATTFGINTHRNRSLKGFLRRISKCPYLKKGDVLRLRNWYVGCADVLVTI